MLDRPVRDEARAPLGAQHCVKFTDEREQVISSQCHLDLLRAPVTVT
jgi:hypothetical protein